MNKRAVAERLVSIAETLAMTPQERIAGNVVELVPKRGSLMESDPRFMIMFRGQPWGELYFNVRGYIAEHGIPIPSDKNEKGVSGLQIGERGLTVYKAEIRNANKLWAQRISSTRESAEKTAMYQPTGEFKSMVGWKTIAFRQSKEVFNEIENVLSDLEMYIDEESVGGTQRKLGRLEQSASDAAKAFQSIAELCKDLSKRLSRTV